MSEHIHVACNRPITYGPAETPCSSSSISLSPTEARANTLELIIKRPIRGIDKPEKLCYYAAGGNQLPPAVLREQLE